MKFGLKAHTPKHLHAVAFGFSFNLRKALQSLSTSKPILVDESLPPADDNMDTLVMPESDMQEMADRLAAEIPEEPNLEHGDQPVALLSN